MRGVEYVNISLFKYYIPIVFLFHLGHSKLYLGKTCARKQLIRLSIKYKTVLFNPLPPATMYP